MVQDPEHIRGDPGDSAQLVFMVCVANVSPGNNPYLVGDPSRRPHVRTPRVARTRSLGEVVRPLGTDVLVCDAEARMF